MIFSKERKLKGFIDGKENIRISEYSLQWKTKIIEKYGQSMVNKSVCTSSDWNTVKLEQAQS